MRHMPCTCNHMLCSVTEIDGHTQRHKLSDRKPELRNPLRVQSCRDRGTIINSCSISLVRPDMALLRHSVHLWTSRYTAASRILSSALQHVYSLHPIPLYGQESHRIAAYTQVHPIQQLRASPSVDDDLTCIDQDGRHVAGITFIRESSASDHLESFISRCIIARVCTILRTVSCASDPSNVPTITVQSRAVCSHCYTVDIKSWAAQGS